jgi:hypothetical protein
MEALVWGVLGSVLTSTPHLLSEVQLDRWKWALAVAPIAYVLGKRHYLGKEEVPALASKRSSMLVLQFLFATSLGAFFRTHFQPLPKPILVWLVLVLSSAIFALAKLINRSNGRRSRDFVFLSYTLRDPCAAIVASSMKKALTATGIEVYDYVPVQEGIAGSAADKADIEGILEAAVSGSCCTCEIISGQCMNREWVQYERALIRKARLPRYFLVLDPEHMHSICAEASGPIKRVDFSRVFGIDAVASCSWDPLTESILTDRLFTPTEGSRMEMIEEALSSLMHSIDISVVGESCRQVAGLIRQTINAGGGCGQDV